jgi:hypothetical protein
MWIGPLVVALALVGVSAYLMLRVAAFYVVVPVYVQPPDGRPGALGWVDPSAGLLGFSPVAELKFRAAAENAVPSLRLVLVDADNTSALLMSPSRTASLLTAWSDGSYVKTRCRRPSLFASGRVSNAVFLSGATLPDAYSCHRKAVSEISLRLGEPFRIDAPEGVLQCYKVANRTAARLFIRTNLEVMLLGVATLVALIVANLIR